MKRGRNGDATFDGDLVDPSVGGTDAPAAASTTSQANAHTPVYVGGGEREARAYVAPTALPAPAAPKKSADKVAIASSVDPRRMQTMKLSPGRIRPPLSPDEQQRPDLAPEGAPSTPSSRYPTSGAHISQRGPRSAMATSTIVRTPPKAAKNSSPPTIIWVLAVALAALVGAGVALWLRKNSTPPAPAPAPAAPAPVSPTNR
jgi:hypothetical protein